jgi:succinoglycan biosynthesis transport protein ExoP
MTSPVVQQLRQEVAQREAKLSELSRRIGANHPQHKAAVTELERLRAELGTEMRAAAQGLLSSTGVAGQREVALRGALEQQRKRVLAMKGDRGELAMLMRDVENAQQAYNAASQRLTQTRMESEVGQSSGSQFDSAAVPIAPAGPTAGKILFLSAVAGLIFGIGIALLSETFRRYVRSERDLVEVMNLPVLAVLAPKGARRQNISYLKSSDVFLIQKS